MGLFRARDNAGATASDLIAQRGQGLSGTLVTADTALRNSAVWACRRLRANLISTLPVDCYRKVDGQQVNVNTPPVLVTPDGRVDITEWLYSSQFDLDGTGNAFGIVTAWDGNKLPGVIELVSSADASVRRYRDGRLEYRLAGKIYDPADVWHERQFTVPGLPVGLSPIGYAAWSIGGYLTAQQFVQSWFTSGAARPGAHLKNLAKTLTPKESAEIKERFKASVANGDIFVTGTDWEWTGLAAQAADAQFIEQMKYGVADACRFFDVPGDLVGAETSTGSITYANITQRLQELLTVHLGPAVTRRERALSGLLPEPRYVKLNRDAILAMDPLTRAEAMKILRDAKLRAPDELRALDNLPPYTEEQIKQLLLLDPPKYPKPTDPTIPTEGP